MNIGSDQIQSGRFSAFIFIVSLFFLIVRFFNLDADFPLGITYSGVVFTDEGWYSNAAVRSYIFGSWYLPGDFNPAINMPIGQLLHKVTLYFLGLGLSSVRATSAVAYVLLVAVATLIVWREFGRLAAALTSLILATNFFSFAYSRLAIMELIATFFVFIGIFLALRAHKEKFIGWLLLASVFISIGILTKTSMVFATPVLAYIVFIRFSGLRERVVFISLLCIVIFFIVYSYNLYAKNMFFDDYSYFNSLNVGSRTHKNFLSWITHIPSIFYGVKSLGIFFAVFTVVSVLSAFVASRKYRTNPIIHVLIFYIFSYLGLISMVSYNPPRYYLPIVVPFAILFVTSCIDLGEGLFCKKIKPKEHKINFNFIYLIFFVSVVGIVSISGYLTKPAYSFLRMSHDIGVIIDRDGFVARRDVVLMGNMADSVAIEIGVRSINSNLGTASVESRFKKFKPQYLLLHTDEDSLETMVKDQGLSFVNVASWDVYENFYDKGQNVKLIKILW